MDFKIIHKTFNTAAIVLLVLLCKSFIFAQTGIPVVNVTLKLKIIDGDLKNSQIVITKKGQPFKVIDPTKEGYAVDLPLGFEYLFTFSKVGYYSKSVLVDTHVPQHREEGKFAKQVSEVTLKQELDNDPIASSQPFKKIAYNISKADFDFDKSFEEDGPKPEKKETPVVPQNLKNNTPANNRNTAPKTEQAPPPVVRKSTDKNKEVKVIQEDTKKITTITLTIDDITYVYKKEEYGWGGTFFYKDGVSITASAFENETK